MSPRNFLPALALCLALFSCAKVEAPLSQTPRIAPPADEAVAAERSQIDAMLSQIEAFTRLLGKPQSFRSVPVVVTTSNQYTNHAAACVAVSGAPQFILVKPSVFENEARISEGELESSLFRVLLHEIGHCYFHREHEAAEIGAPGQFVELAVKRKALTGKIQFPCLDATVMVPENLTVPIALEKYYVAEILGLARAKTLADLASYASLKYVDEPTPQ
jgi:hypothetical protein